MSHWQFVIRPLTPVHIGTGEPLEPYEYAILGEQFYRLDLDAFLMALPREQALAFAETAGRNLAAARSFLQGRAELVGTHARYRCPAAKVAIQHYEERLDEALSDLTVRETLRAGGMTILPGSSIKGAIRTAVLYDEVRKPVDGRRYGRRSDRLQRDTFGHRNPLDDPFKALKISDSLPPYGDVGQLRLAEVHVRKGGRWGPTRRGRLMVRLETTGGELEGRVRASRHEVQIDEAWQRGARPRYRLEMGKVIAACRRFYDEHLAAEAGFVRDLAGAARAYAALQAWRGEMPDHGFLLRLGWGSGLDGVSVNRALDRPKQTISRRLLDGGMPLGWVEVQVLDGDGQPHAVERGADWQPEELETAPPEPTEGPANLEDLRPGMVLEGTVRNTASFGAFVDVGVGKDGLVHISELKEGWVDSVEQVVRRGQRVRVRVLSVDVGRARIGLSMKGVEQP